MTQFPQQKIGVDEPRMRSFASNTLGFMFEVDETIHQQDPRSTYKFWICIMVLLIAVINICWLDMKMIREIEAGLVHSSLAST